MQSSMQKLKSFFLRPRSKKTKIISGVAVVVISLAIVFGWHRFGAFAQSVVDSFTDSSKIAATWQATVDTGAGEVKAAQKTCDAFTWYCAQSTVCADTLGDGTYIIVAQADAPATKTWKNANTNCDKPQCGADGGQDGDNLKADNTLSFTSYPARDYCKSIGGRLPTKTELNCIYTNRATFGNNFASSNYWSSTEYSTTSAWYQYFSTGGQGYSNKTSSLYVRCVRGW